MVDASWFLGRDTIPDKREAQQFEGSHIKVVSSQSIEGWSRVRGGWNNGDAYTVYFLCFRMCLLLLKAATKGYAW